MKRINKFMLALIYLLTWFNLLVLHDHVSIVFALAASVVAIWPGKNEE